MSVYWPWVCAGAHEHFVYVCGDQKSTLGIAFQESFTPGLF